MTDAGRQDRLFLGGLPCLIQELHVVFTVAGNSITTNAGMLLSNLRRVGVSSHPGIVAGSVTEVSGASFADIFQRTC